MSSGTLLGAPVDISGQRLTQWINSLASAWRELTAREAGDLESDLRDLEPLFGPKSRIRTIRERVYDLTPRSPNADPPPRQALMPIAGGLLITPAGRTLLHVLTEHRESGRPVIEPADYIGAIQALIDARAAWHQKWLSDQFETTLSPPPLAAALLLLINGSIGEDRALRLPADEEADKALAGVVIPLLARFAEALGSKRTLETSTLRSHWAFSQVSRVLGRDVARMPSDEATLMYVKPGRPAHLLDELEHRLAKVADAHRRTEALDQFVNDYRAIRGQLALRGLMHEDPTATQRIVARLSDPLAGL